jgi:hypothetical protein
MHYLCVILQLVVAVACINSCCNTLGACLGQVHALAAGVGMCLDR